QVIHLAVVARSRERVEVLRREERRPRPVGTDTEKSSPVAAVVEVNRGELPQPHSENGRQGQDGGAFHEGSNSYIIATGGAGSSGRPAFESGIRIIAIPKRAITPRPNTYDGSGKNSGM